MNRNVASARLLFIGILLCFASSTEARQVGTFAYRGAPEDFNSSKFNDTVTVSDTIVAMAENVRVINHVFSSVAVDTPSIFFIIDHSTSMSYSSPKNDLPGNRFIVTSAFIDTIAKKYPSADVGIAVFKGWLHFRAGDSPYFAALPTPNDSGGAYLPLYRLNGSYSGQTGVGILKSFLQTKQAVNNGTTYTELVYTPAKPWKEGTNINVGFDAAKKALLASPRAKECHYIVFLSDGAGNQPENNPNAYQAGTGVPTTFTIYFTQNATVPSSISAMTGNIRQNGYSSSNSKSNYWPFFNTDFNALMTFLMNNVYNAINQSLPVTPKSITVGSSTVSTWNSADSTFKFGSLFPLTGQVTPFTYTIVYGMGAADTVRTVRFSVKRQAGHILPPADFEVKHWDRDIVFRHKGAPVTVATNVMDSMELFFSWDGAAARYKYTNAAIDLYTAIPPADRETVTLAASGQNAFRGTIRRTTIAGKTQMNGVIETALAAGDSIIAVFRNNETPKLPLDTLRIALPMTAPTSLKSAITKDLDGNGYLDHIELSFDILVSIAKESVPSFTVQCNGITFSIDSIIKLSDSVYFLCIKEQQTPYPQTSWTPVIAIASLPGVLGASAFPVTDGAPPVIWNVTNLQGNVENHANDTVTVTLSEKITGTDGNPFSISNHPYQAFSVWSKNGAAFTKVNTMLTGIPAFTNVLADSILVFVMKNNNNLTENHWFSIQTVSQVLCDKAGNFPADANQKVQVKKIALVPAEPSAVAGTVSPFIRAVSGRGGLVVRYCSGAKTGAPVVIYNIDGRQVKRLPPAAAGRVATYVWTPAPAGIYLIKFMGSRSVVVARKTGY